MKYLFFCFVFIFLSSTVDAQSNRYSITGKITQSDNQQALSFVNVILYKAKDSTLLTAVLSDDQGHFLIDNVAPDNYYILVKFIGFADVYRSNINVSGSNKKIDLGEIQLSISNTLKEVVVTEEKKLIENTVDKRIYNVDQDLTSKGGSLTDVLSNVPSVDVDQDGNVSLRGNSDVNILIDGRQSTTTKSTLSTIPASSIERIEIINNPSAKYNPEGMSGIINIVLKKNKLRGVNGNIDVSYASGNQYNASTGISYRNRFINVYGNYSYRYSESYSKSTSDRIRQVNGETEHLHQLTTGDRFRGAHTAKIGADFTLKPNHILGVSLTGMLRQNNSNGVVHNSLSYNDILSSYWERASQQPSKANNIDANLNYQWTFKEDKGNLMFDFTESIGNNKSYGYYNQSYFDHNYVPNNTPRLLQNQINPSQFSIFSGQMDLTRNYSHKIRLEAGAKVMIDGDNNTQYRETYQDTLMAYTPDVGINNQFKLNRQTYAAYGTFGQEVKKFKYQLGLRLEQTFMNPVLITTNQSFKNNYLSFFPSAHFSYTLKKKGELNFSYSRRISRPSVWALNPFPSYSDPFNLRMGNPALKPEYINSFELGYTKDWKKKLSIITTLYFRQANNIIQRVRAYYPNGTAASTYANISQNYNFGVEAIVIYTPFTWWKNTLSGNFYQTIFKDDSLSNNNSGVSGSVKLMTSFEFWKKTTTLQLNGQYNMPMISPQGIVTPKPYMNIALQRNLLDGKLTLGLRVTDIFNTRSFYMNLSTQGVQQTALYKWQTRRVYVTLSYRFGKLQEGGQRKKRGGDGSPDDGGGGDMGF